MQLDRQKQRWNVDPAGNRLPGLAQQQQAGSLHDPYQYLKDVLTRLPTHKASRVGELLPHRWRPEQSA